MPYRRRYARRKAKWNTVFVEREMHELAKPSGYLTAIQTVDIVENSIPMPEDLAAYNTAYPSAAPVLKIKHAQASIIIPNSTFTGYISFIDAFITYLPQGVNWDINTPTYHPEWVMSRRLIPLVTGGATTVFMRSPLMRNLNSGDKIVLTLKVTYLNEAPPNAKISPYVQTSCVTRAN